MPFFFNFFLIKKNKSRLEYTLSAFRPTRQYHIDKTKIQQISETTK